MIRPSVFVDCHLLKLGSSNPQRLGDRVRNSLGDYIPKRRLPGP